MSEQIKNSSYQQHLMGGSVELLESKLGIKAREGFPQSWEMKDKFPWDSDEDFNEFVSYCKDANALSSNMGHIRMATSYRSYIVFYKGKYYDWESESDYDSFVEFGSTAFSISGRYYNSREETSYETTIILYRGSYYVQVEKDWEYSGSTEFYNKSFQDYLSALKYAYGVVFND